MNERIGMSLMVHDDMEQAVGDSIAAFAEPLLSTQHKTDEISDVSNIKNNVVNIDSIRGGIYFPEEVPSIEYRRRVLDNIKSTANELNLVI